MTNKPKIIKKDERERREDAVLNRNSEAGIEINFLRLLMRKYPEKAKEFARELPLRVV